MLLDLVCKILLWIINKGYCSVVFLSCDVFGNTGFTEWVRKRSFFFYFCKSLWKINVLVQAATTDYQSLGGLNDEHLFLTALEARTSKIKALVAYLLWWEYSSWFADGYLSLYPCMAERETDCTLFLLRILVPFWGAPTKWCYCFPRALLPNTIMLGYIWDRAQTWSPSQLVLILL